MPRRYSSLERLSDVEEEPETLCMQQKNLENALDEASEATTESRPAPKPRLKTRDLEFDYDRTQLRDPRSTPGRQNRPWLEVLEADENFKNRLRIWKLKRPRGDDEWFAKMYYLTEALSIERQKLMWSVFFVDGKGPDGVDANFVEDYVKDHISKDLGVPFHQIDAEQIQEWEKKQFPKHKANEWWREPKLKEKRRKGIDALKEQEKGSIGYVRASLLLMPLCL